MTSHAVKADDRVTLFDAIIAGPWSVVSGQWSAVCRLYTSGRDLEEISPTLAHDLLAVLTRIQPAKMT